jgi:stearoyl-CoA desaturase (delta-9 desaturase)
LARVLSARGGAIFLPGYRKELALSAQPQTDALPPLPGYDIKKLTFVIGVHLLAVFTTVFWIAGTLSVSWLNLLTAFGWFVLSSTTIAAGYHRYYAHKTYEATWPLRLFFLVTGTGAVQGSAIQWASQHRDHHTFCDEARDPYNINRGFWHAHIGWVIRKTEPDYGRVKDLAVDPLNRFQHKFFGPLSIVSAFLVPGAVGYFFGEFWSFLLIGGVIRLTIQWHMTFCVNSVAHWWGSQKYSTNHTARGSWWLSFLVWGEMDHNYHHTFPNDFRTGTHWYDFDPGKWFIWGCSKIGLAKDLKFANKERIKRARELRASSAD